MIWSQFAMAVAGGVCGAVLTQAATFGREHLNRRAEGRFAALTLALMLEDYASKATEPVSTLSTYGSSGQSTEEPSGSIPPLQNFPDKIDWRNLGVRYAEKVLSFRVMVASADGYVASVWAHEGPSGAWASAADKGVELGLKALQLAKQLRKNFKLPPRSADADYDFENYLEEEAAKIAVRKAKEKKWNNEIYGAIVGGSASSS